MPKGVYVKTQQHKRRIGLAMSEYSKKTGRKPPSSKGKTYEELYGKEKAKLLKKKRSEAKKGSKSEFWRGGNPANREKHQGSEYHHWRTAIFTRDNWTCQTCQFRGYVEAHHIKSWANYPSLRLDTSNGVTLCKSCHRLANIEQRHLEKIVRQ